MLKDLKEFNREARNRLRIDPPNGIRCPKCNERGNIAELVDDLTSPMLLTYPPQIKVYCKWCDFMNYRVVG